MCYFSTFYPKITHFSFALLEPCLAKIKILVEKLFVCLCFLSLYISYREMDISKVPNHFELNSILVIVIKFFTIHTLI